ncbi:hypothetical protein Ddye_001814 [Dipteronia dyeriana]|uniref:Uncharacterized protein n=1 Tax=Dipteronia dyeriana TaxID=168575 RepID=A0AAD9XPL7_9ROSI|nr:hypothetical protein Ddye_001814 [Dipteronia dyeriana]
MLVLDYAQIYDANATLFCKNLPCIMGELVLVLLTSFYSSIVFRYSHSSIIWLNYEFSISLLKELPLRMGRGVSAGGGQSSLGYLFGRGETANTVQAPPSKRQTADSVPLQKPSVASQPRDQQIPAGVHGNLTNNYIRADGQNCGNFITDRPSTKVHAAPGGGSSLGYLFGGGGK